MNISICFTVQQWKHVKVKFKILLLANNKLLFQVKAYVK